MIIKSKGHRRSPGIFQYLVRYAYSDKDRATEENSFSFFHNILSRDVNSIVNEFETNDTFRKKRTNGLALHHIILSFNPEDSDNITLGMLNDLVQKFIELRGDDTLYFGRLHNSDGHPHVHLIMSANKYRSNQSTRISKKEFQRIHRELEAYQQQKYPELSQSLVKVGDIDFSNRPKGLTEPEKHISSRGQNVQKVTLKNQILGLLRKSNTTADFYDLIREKGFDIYKRNGKISGIISRSGRKFRFTTLGINPKVIWELDRVYLERFYGDEGKQREI